MDPAVISLLNRPEFIEAPCKYEGSKTPQLLSLLLLAGAFFFVFKYAPIEDKQVARIPEHSSHQWHAPRGDCIRDGILSNPPFSPCSPLSSAGTSAFHDPSLVALIFKKTRSCCFPAAHISHEVPTDCTLASPKHKSCRKHLSYWNKWQ